MAIAKIIKVKVNPNAAIDYVRNPDKTNERLLVSYDGCTESNIELCFKMALTNKIQNRKSEGVLAYHFIQSFAPTDEVTPKKAHELGMKFTKKTFGGKYSFICATHTDKGHIHNHFVMCAAERGMTRMRLDDNLSLLHTIQKNNDELCKTLRSSSNKTSVIEGVATLALYVIFVRRTRDLLTASFRFHLTMEPLLFGYTLPTIWACSGLSPVRARPWRANTKKRRIATTLLSCSEDGARERYSIICCTFSFCLQPLYRWLHRR